MPLSSGETNHLHGDTIATSLATLSSGILYFFGDVIEKIDANIVLVLQWLTGISLILLILRHAMALFMRRP
jgi:hypothetical protein